jgi:TPR repeat protein
VPYEIQHFLDYEAIESGKATADHVNGFLARLAEAGDPGAMFQIGARYRAGLGGLPKDDVEAIRWYRKAARAGDTDAMNNLGVMSENGTGGGARLVFEGREPRQ